MDFGGNMSCHSNEDREEASGNSNSNGNSFAWHSWDTNSRLINALHTTSAATSHHNDGVYQHRHHQPPFYAGDAPHVHPDPHLTCLRLGKRRYFEDPNAPAPLALGGVGVGKGAKAYYGNRSGGGDGGSAGVKTPSPSFTVATVPRCQVEGCHVTLLNAKDYHRRHKVCEMHSKAPKVVVLGLEQRFCQQCSRFHVVSAFDDSKRSCRRRLAGHNERRRKSSNDSVARNSSQGGCALSLLSSRNDSWLSQVDLSIRCSAALRELIAENRASLMARQLLVDRDWHLHHHAMEDFKEIQPESNYFPQQMFPHTQ